MLATDRQTGYPSVDKPWLKYYSAEALTLDISNTTIFENIWNCNRNRLDNYALEYYGKKITYRTFFEDIDWIASSLLSIGVKQGDVVAVCAVNAIDVIELIYAINKVGAVANMISGLADKESLTAFIKNTESKFLFVVDVFLNNFDMDEFSNLHVVVMNVTNSMGLISKLGARYLKKLKPAKIKENSMFVTWKTFLKKENRNVVPVGKTSDIALICYTGGSTGGSKPVMLSNYSINSTAEQYLMGGANVKPGQKWLNYIPVFVAFGLVASVHLGLLGGNELILRIPNSEPMSVALKKYRINHIVYGPYFWEQLADEDISIDLSELIEPTTGGDKLSLAVEEKINKYLAKNGSTYPLLNGYGMTEVAAGVAVNTKEAHKPGSIGIPLCKNVLSAFDLETGKELKYGEEGEICILSPSMMKGYLNMPEETANMLKKHEDGNVWVHTGDLGYVDEDGFVYLSGRLKRFFLYKRVGYIKKVFSLEIEKHLMENEIVEACAVVPMDHKEYQQVPIAFIKVKRGRSELNDEQIAAKLAEFMRRFDESLQPVRYHILQEFPVTSVSKVDYKKLEEMAACANKS